VQSAAQVESVSGLTQTPSPQTGPLVQSAAQVSPELHVPSPHTGPVLLPPPLIWQAPLTQTVPPAHWALEVQVEVLGAGS
jgi:hypothetical protein